MYNNTINTLEYNHTVLDLKFNICSDGFSIQILRQDLHIMIHQNRIYIALHSIYVKTYVTDNRMKYTVIEERFIIKLSIPKCDPSKPYKIILLADLKLGF